MNAKEIESVCRRILAEECERIGCPSHAELFRDGNTSPVNMAIHRGLSRIATELAAAEPVKRPSVDEIRRIVEREDGVPWKAAERIHALIPPGPRMAEVAAELKGDARLTVWLRCDCSGELEDGQGKRMCDWYGQHDAISAIRTAVAALRAAQVPTLAEAQRSLDALKGLATFSGHTAILDSLQEFLQAQEAE